jgi:hypothetical protein
MPYPSQPSWLDHPNDIWWGVHSMKLLVMQSSPLPRQRVFSRILLCEGSLCGETQSLPLQPALKRSWNYNWQGKTKKLEEETAPVTFCSSQIPHAPGTEPGCARLKAGDQPPGLGLKRLIVILPPRNRGFDTTSVHMRFVVNKVALGHVYLQILSFPLSVSLHQCSIFIFQSCTTDAI